MPSAMSLSQSCRLHESVERQPPLMCLQSRAAAAIPCVTHGPVASSRGPSTRRQRPLPWVVARCGLPVKARDTWGWKDWVGVRPLQLTQAAGRLAHTLSQSPLDLAARWRREPWRQCPLTEGCLLAPAVAPCSGRSSKRKDSLQIIIITERLPVRSSSHTHSQCPHTGPGALPPRRWERLPMCSLERNQERPLISQRTFLTRRSWHLFGRPRGGWWKRPACVSPFCRGYCLGCKSQRNAQSST